MSAVPAPAEFAFGTPFAEQIAFFRRKLNLPTEWWDDITRAAHDRAFIVAGAGTADLVQDLRTALQRSMVSDDGTRSGGGLAEFRKGFKAAVAKNGWTGWTGEGSAAGEAWRTRIIYQTNMATSYAAGRYRQLTDPGFAAEHPFWKYVHADGLLYPRPQHLAWNGLTLPMGHAFWKTHAAPNGWGCRCEIHPVAAPEPGAKTAPPTGWQDIDPKTGAPVGIDKGFDYAPGANAATPLQDLIDAKLIKLDAPIGAEMWQALKPALAMEREAAWWETLDGWLADAHPRGHRAVVGSLDPQTVRWLADNGQAAPASAEIAVADKLPRGAKQRRHIGKGDGLTLAEWRALPALLDEPAGIYFDTHSRHLIFVSDGLGPTKAAVEFEAAPGPDSLNEVVSAFRVSDVDVAGAVKGGRWQVVK